jgi:hypothetical protein
LLMQILGETEQQKLQIILDRIKGLSEKAQKVDLKDPNAKDALKGLLSDLKANADEAKTLASGTAAEDALHIVEDGMTIGDSALAK